MSFDRPRSQFNFVLCIFQRSCNSGEQSGADRGKGSNAYYIITNRMSLTQVRGSWELVSRCREKVNAPAWPRNLVIDESQNFHCQPPHASTPHYSSHSKHFAC